MGAVQIWTEYKTDKYKQSTLMWLDFIETIIEDAIVKEMFKNAVKGLRGTERLRSWHWLEFMKS